MSLPFFHPPMTYKSIELTMCVLEVCVMGAMAMTLLWCVVMMITTAISGYTRYNCFDHRDTNASAYFNAISTGVILSAAFTHLLPDAIGSLQMFKYPVACACSLIGFLSMVMVETVLTYRTIEDEHQTAYEVHSKHDCSIHNNEAGLSPVHNFSSKGVPSNVFSRIPHHSDRPVSCFNRQSSHSEPETFRPLPSSGEHDHSHHHSHDTSEDLEASSLHGHPPGGVTGYGSIPSNAPHHVPISSSSHAHSHSHGHSHSHSHSPLKSSHKQQLTSASLQTFWIALVIHSTMEGLGMGAADSFLSQISVVFAILIHKVFESIALAGLLLDGNISTFQSRFMFTIFALATPIGALCTALLQSYINSTESDDSGKILDGVVTALAAGSFMYIGTMEMLPNMLNSCQNMPIAMSMFVLSAGAMAALAAVI